MDSAIDAVCTLSLCAAVLFPTPLIPDGEIVVSVRQHVRLSLLPELEGNTQRSENFFCRLVAEGCPPPIRGSRAPEQSAIPRPTNPWNRLPAMPIKLNNSNSDAFSQVEKGVGTALIQAMQDNQQLTGF